MYWNIIHSNGMTTFLWCINILWVFKLPSMVLSVLTVLSYNPMNSIKGSFFPYLHIFSNIFFCFLIITILTVNKYLQHGRSFPVSFLIYSLYKWGKMSWGIKSLAPGQGLGMVEHCCIIPATQKVEGGRDRRIMQSRVRRTTVRGQPNQS
jgi:hypothetical protein